jgi:hypothetical protein
MRVDDPQVAADTDDMNRRAQIALRALSTFALVGLAVGIAAIVGMVALAVWLGKGYGP